MSTVIMQAKSGQVLLSDMANPVVDIELTTWKTPVMNDSPHVNPAELIFMENATSKAATNMVPT